MLPDVAHSLRLGLKNSGQDTSIQALRDVWRIADDAGFDHVYVHQIGPDQAGFINFYQREILPQFK